MDREQAIKIIKDCKEKSFKRTLYTLDEYYEAVDMAIEALEQQPDAIHNEREQAYMKGYEDASKRFRTEPCEDAISRQAVLDAFWKLNVELRPNAIDAILSMVNDLPSVSTEKTGHWIDIQSHWSDLTRLQCTCDQCGNFSNKITPFCPNCGAKMGGGRMTVDFAKEYLLDDCDDCPENENGECMTQSHCFEIKRMAIQALEQTRWIPFTKRPMTDEEREHYREWSDIEGAEIFDCPLPEDGQEVLVSYGDYVCVDVFCKDDGCYFEGVDIDDADAWMPLPKPYKAESEDAE